jgi:hypothetical protein
MALSRIGIGLDAKRRFAVDDSDDAAAQVGLDHEHLDGIGGRADDTAHLGHLLHGVEDVHGVAVSQEHDEGMSGPDVLRVPNGKLDQLVVVTGVPDESGP